MKISTKGRYALRLMLDLALAEAGEPVPLRDVARRQEISDKYLEQIVTPLSRSGLVRSVRGAGGGYLLTRDAAEYTVGEILRPLEGSLAPVSCVDGSECCGRAARCVTMASSRGTTTGTCACRARTTSVSLPRPPPSSEKSSSLPRPPRTRTIQSASACSA